MPLPINLTDLLHGKSVEWERLEFKAGWNPLDVLHTLCAFANDFHNLGGGYVVIGVGEKNGRPVLPPAGIDSERIDAIQKEILKLGYHAIQPAYHPIVAPCVIDGAAILVIWSPGGQTRPYKARLSLAKDGREYAYFIRKQSSTVRAKGAEEIELLSLAASVPFDDRLNPQARVDDLSHALMAEYLAEVDSDLASEAGTLPALELGRRMNVVGGPGEAPFPLNVGLLFFSEAPRRFFPATQIDVVCFPQGAAGDTFVEKTFHGPLPRMLREALDYIYRNHIDEIVTKHAHRAEATRVNNFPFEAVEEAVVNAVYHRSYEEREPVEVRIDADALVVLSYPGPDRSVTLDQLRRGRAQARRYRNRRIGEFLKELDLTEGRATGIPKILRAMAANGSPPPEFETDEGRSYFLVRLPIHALARAGRERPLPAGSESGRDQEGTKWGPSGDQARILRRCLIEREITDLMRLAGRAHRTKFRDQVLRPLLIAGWLEMTVPDKPTSNRQRYRTTGAGRAALAACPEQDS
ncbi:MAG: putative DNA binding domain-containing protein [Candidatus Accumulibacter sp.]|jgi:ATP-dependent DNA helicase RecG|nr:putative DNA binding domain-containing protein [Accumulibacter sp.]